MTSVPNVVKIRMLEAEIESMRRDREHMLEFEKIDDCIKRRERAIDWLKAFSDEKMSWDKICKKFNINFYGHFHHKRKII